MSSKNFVTVLLVVATLDSRDTIRLLGAIRPLVGTGGFRVSRIAGARSEAIAFRACRLLGSAGGMMAMFTGLSPVEPESSRKRVLSIFTNIGRVDHTLLCLKTTRLRNEPRS